jgi:hypothetical protein
MLCLARAATHVPPEPAAPGVTDIELEPILPEQVEYDMEQGCRCTESLCESPCSVPEPLPRKTRASRPSSCPPSSMK